MFLLTWFQKFLFPNASNRTCSIPLIRIYHWLWLNSNLPKMGQPYTALGVSILFFDNLHADSWWPYFTRFGGLILGPIFLVIALFLGYRHGWGRCRQPHRRYQNRNFNNSELSKIPAQYHVRFHSSNAFWNGDYQPIWKGIITIYGMIFSGIKLRKAYIKKQW